MSSILRFGDFILDAAAFGLRHRGRVVRLERRPMDLLLLLVERRGQLVSRTDIAERLWGRDVFVDVETGVTTVVWKLRTALRDSAETPTFIETVPGRGYRFVAPVEVVSADGVQGEDGVLSAMASEPDVAPVAPAAPLPVDEAARSMDAPQPRLSAGARLAALLAGSVLVAAFVSSGRIGDAGAGLITLAVLPFESSGLPEERQYLADGLTEETSALLAQVDPERLTVKGRATPFRGSTMSAAAIGRELSVDYLVQGSIQAEGDRLRVTSTLIRARDQEHIWSRSYERRPESLLDLQVELSATIAQEIRLRLSPERVHDLGRRQTTNPAAYDEYLRARYLENRRTPAATRRALQHYERATALDKDYALAWAGMGVTYAASVLNSDAAPRVVAASARDAVAQAVRANADLAEVRHAVGYVRWTLERDWRGAEAATRLAIERDGSNAAAYRTLGHVLSQMGRHVEARQALHSARELEPWEPLSHALSSQVAFQARDYPSAVEHARRVIQLDADLWIGYAQLGHAYEWLDQHDLALEALADAARRSGGNSKVVSARGFLLARRGRTEEARAVLATLEAVSRERYVPPYAVALVYAGLGDRAAVFEWLDKAYDADDVHLMFLTTDARWDAYREDQRFARLLERCGFTGPW